MSVNVERVLKESHANGPFIVFGSNPLLPSANISKHLLADTETRKRKRKGRWSRYWEEGGSGLDIAELGTAPCFLIFVACRLICVTLITTSNSWTGKRGTHYSIIKTYFGFFMLPSGRWEGSPLSTSLLLQIPRFQNFILAFRVDTAYTIKLYVSQVYFFTCCRYVLLPNV